MWLWFSFKVSINPSLYSFEKRTVGKKVINAKFFSLINNYLYSKKKFLTIKKVLYHGTKPQDFERSEQIVLVGKMKEEGDFQASSILMKCPSKYNDGKPELQEYKAQS